MSNSIESIIRRKMLGGLNILDGGLAVRRPLNNIPANNLNQMSPVVDVEKLEHVKSVFPNVCPRWIQTNIRMPSEVLIGFIADNLDSENIPKVTNKRIVPKSPEMLILEKKKRPVISVEKGFSKEMLLSTEEGKHKYMAMVDMLINKCLELIPKYQPQKVDDCGLVYRYLSKRYPRVRMTFIGHMLNFKRQNCIPKFPEMVIVIILELVTLGEEDALYKAGVLSEKNINQNLPRPYVKLIAAKVSSIGLDNRFIPGSCHDVVEQVHEIMVEAIRGKVTFTCGVCFSDMYEDDEEECQTIDTKPSDAHKFCGECIGLHANACAEEGRVLPNGAGIPCMEPDCSRHFSISQICGLLERATLKVLEKKIQQAVLISSGVEIERCKYCNFAAEMGAAKEVDKVFNCSECNAAFCRLCLHDWTPHMGLRCDELENETTKKRKQLEEDLSNAVLHNCPTCHLSFEKEAGCNKMTCSCKTTQCYVCREVNIAYDHFCNHMRDPNVVGCPSNCGKNCLLWQDVAKAMAERRNQILKKARLELGDEAVNGWA